MTTRPDSARWPEVGDLQLHVDAVGGVDRIAVHRAGKLAELRLVVDVGDVDAATASTLTSTFAHSTGNLDPLALKRRLSGLGAAWWVEHDITHLRWSAYCPPEHAAQVVALLGEALTRTAPDAESLERAKTAAAAELQRRCSDGVGQVEDALRRIVFAEQAVGMRFEPADVLGLDDSDVAGTLARAARAPQSLVLVGDVDVNGVDKALAQWPAVIRRAPVDGHFDAAAGNVWLVDTPGSPQAVVAVVGGAPGRDAPAAPALAVALRVVGGTATSRVSRRLREELGWAYYANVHYSSVGGVPAVVGRTAVATERAVPAVTELLNELKAAANGSLSQQDVDRGARSQAGRLAVETHTAAGLADDVASRIEQGAAPGGRTRFIERLSEVSGDDVAAAASRYLDPARLDVVIAADAALVADAATTELGLVRPL